ncbi:MAG: tyrosine-type recombinase/integrase [Elusimicrobiota bacterium]|jgi:integrase|nr:tyrosine-type recombinase/integrase [Elusimicrobiota bacterium]
MTDDKVSQLKRLFASQEQELLQSLATIRKQMELLNEEKPLFRLYINKYTKDPIYYAHLFDDNGKQTDARMSCFTMDMEAANLYAKKHREEFLKDYFDKKNKDDFYKLLTEYYTDKSELFKKAKQKRSVREKHIKEYKAFIDNYFIPFLQKKKITSFNKGNNFDLIEEFQIYCQDKNQNVLRHSLSTKTINNNVSCAVAPIFNQVLKEKSIFALNIKMNLKPKDGERKSIGVIPIRTTFAALMDDRIWRIQNEAEKGIPFLVNKIKNLKKYRLYCLLSNLCGLRNSEIFFLRKKSVLLIGKIRFLNIENSRIDGTGTKTKAGKRLVPLHSFVYEKLIEYIDDESRTDYIFWNGSKTIVYTDFLRARTILALLCGYSSDDIKEHNIVFYSFRHFFKTMITNTLNNKDLVEYYMGHTNNNDMSKNYLHLGNVGNTYIEDNGKKIIAVIENYCADLFTPTYTYKLKEPVCKEVMYYDDAHPNKGKKRLIWTIPDPEAIESITDDDTEDDKSIMEQFNKHNTKSPEYDPNSSDLADYDFDIFDNHERI